MYNNPGKRKREGVKKRQLETCFQVSTYVRSIPSNISDADSATALQAIRNMMASVDADAEPDEEDQQPEENLNSGRMKIVSAWVKASEELRVFSNCPTIPYNTYRARILATLDGHYNDAPELLNRKVVQKAVNSVPRDKIPNCSDNDMKDSDTLGWLQALVQQLDNNHEDLPKVVTVDQNAAVTVTAHNWKAFLANTVADNK